MARSGVQPGDDSHASWVPTGRLLVFRPDVW